MVGVVLNIMIARLDSDTELAITNEQRIYSCSYQSIKHSNTVKNLEFAAFLESGNL